MEVLNNITAPDNGPTAASTVDGTPPYSRAIVDVSNSAIYWQVKQGDTPASAQWAPANGAFMGPGSRRLPTTGKVFGVRFWAVTPLAQLASGLPQAQVNVNLS